VVDCAACSVHHALHAPHVRVHAASNFANSDPEIFPQKPVYDVHRRNSTPHVRATSRGRVPPPLLDPPLPDLVGRIEGKMYNTMMHCESTRQTSRSPSVVPEAGDQRLPLAHNRELQHPRVGTTKTSSNLDPRIRWAGSITREGGGSCPGRTFMCTSSRGAEVGARPPAPFLARVFPLRLRSDGPQPRDRRSLRTRVDLDDDAAAVEAGRSQTSANSSEIFCSREGFVTTPVNHHQPQLKRHDQRTKSECDFRARVNAFSSAWRSR
jgi:hypothetical protein